MSPENFTPGAVQVVRATIFGTWFLKVLTTPVQLYADIPAFLFARRGVMELLPHDLLIGFVGSSSALLAFKLVLLVCCAGAAAGLRGYRIFAWSAALMLLLFDGVMKGFNGFINHAQMGLLYATFVLALFPLESRRLARDSGPSGPGQAPQAPLVIIAVLLALTYCFVGMRRLVIGGAALYTGDAVATYFAVNALAPSRLGFTFGYYLAQSQLLLLLAKFGFAMITLAELATPLCLRFRAIRLAWLAIMIPFHLSTLLLMNIFFWENLLIITLIFTPLAARIGSWVHGAARRLGRSPLAVSTS